LIKLPCHIFCLRGTSFNGDRNYNQCPLGLPL
jgi:hypothetical protein